MPSAATCLVVKTIIEDYQKKVSEVALAQCRCATGADLKTFVVKPEPSTLEHPKAA